MSRPSALWLFLTTYALLYGAFGMQSPFVPALLRERGLQAQDIGLVLAAAMVVRVLAGPVVAHAADRLRRHTLILCGCALFAALASISYLLTHSLVGLLCVALLHAAMLGPIAPISDALAATAARASRLGTGRRFDYGWLRTAGSASFALGTLMSGWQSSAAGLPAAMWTSGALLVLGSAVALLLPNLPLARSRAARPGATMLRDGVLLLRLPVYRRMLVTAALLEGSHALHDSFSVIRWRSAGIDFFTISALWSEPVFAEVVVFLLIGPWLVRRLGPNGSMALAAGAGVLRWTVAAFTTSLGLLACIQPLHGLTFSLFHLAAIRLIVAVTPVRLAATAQAVYRTLSAEGHDFGAFRALECHGEALDVGGQLRPLLALGHFGSCGSTTVASRSHPSFSSVMDWTATPSTLASNAGRATYSDTQQRKRL
jgi:MFS transporter, PPP family, 3-phenylpropionic acid transporter